MGVRKFCNKHFRWGNFGLDHEFTSDFYISCWQKNRASFPLLFIRAILFLGCLGITVTSLVMLDLGLLGYWFVFMTHWGLLLITATTGAACAVSARAYFKGPIEGSFGLPWYLKAYWVLFNMATTNAFFITVFYFGFLTEFEIDYSLAYSEVLDIFMHGINSALMFVLLLISRHPVRLLHFYQPAGFALLYLVFNVIYYFAGGLSPFGTTYIYPMMDWTEPGVAMIAVAGSAVAIVVIHTLVFLIATLRDWLATKCTNSSMSISIVNI